MRSTIEKLAVSQLQAAIKEHKLVGWKATIVGGLLRRSKFSARTVYNKKQIQIARQYLNKKPTKSCLRNTITHEIAHALTPGDGHGAKWVAMHKQLGGTGRRHTSQKRPNYCGNCRKITMSMKRIRVCPKCKS